MPARHRVSKLLLRHGHVYPRDKSTWTSEHRRWLASRGFDEPNTELAYIDAMAAVDGLIGRRDALAERLSHVASDAELWPIVDRLRAFRGIDTLTALALVCEIGAGIASPAPTSRRHGSAWCPRSANQASHAKAKGSPRPDRVTLADSWSKRPDTTNGHLASASHSATAKTASPTTSCRSPGAHSIASTAHTNDSASAVNTPPWPRPRRLESSPASAGRQPPRPNPHKHPTRT